MVICMIKQWHVVGGGVLPFPGFVVQCGISCIPGSHANTYPFIFFILCMYCAFEQNKTEQQRRERSKMEISIQVAPSL